jgi:2-hydroxycyclohexanecarboxyl-CoA dehydrogenase
MTGANARLSGRRVLVTGAAAGIGAATARAMTDEGAQVVLCDINGQAAEQLAAEIGARAAVLDVTNEAAVRRLVEAAGPFDVLVNNAVADQHAFFTETTAADWARLIAVNLTSVLICTHAVLPQMQAGRFGRIINIASEAARQGSKGGSVYAAAKGGVVSFTKSIARENARYGVTANAICPGPIDTPMLRQGVERGGEKLLAAMAGATLLGRLGEPWEVAAAAAFLASDDASFITGEVLGVSGGMGC